MAVDHRYQGQKFGSALLGNAASRTAQNLIAAFTIIVDAIDEKAVAFHEHHGFMAYGSLSNRLTATLKSFLPAV